MTQNSRRKMALTATTKKELLEAVGRLRQCERRIEEIRRERAAAEERMGLARVKTLTATHAAALEDAGIVLERAKQKFLTASDGEKNALAAHTEATELVASLRQQLKLIEQRDF